MHKHTYSKIKAVTMNTPKEFFTIMPALFIFSVGFVLPMQGPACLEPSNNKNMIVFFKVSSSSSGSSSLARSVIEQNSTFVAVDDDAFFTRCVVEYAEEFFPEDYQKLLCALEPCNLPHALWYDDIMLNDACNDLERAQALSALKNIQPSYRGPDGRCKKSIKKRFKKSLISYVRAMLEQGKNIVYIGWFFQPQKLHEKFENTVIITTFVTCNLLECYKRLCKRNEQAIATKNLLEKRCYGHLIGGYINSFIISKEASPEAIFEYHRRDVETLFNQIHEHLPEDPEVVDPRRYNEITHAELIKQLCVLFPEGDERETVFLTPAEEYDVVINTTSTSPHDAAQRLLLTVNSIKASAAASSL